VIAGNNLVALLHALATDHADRALNIVVSEPDVAEGLRQALYAAIAARDVPASAAPSSSSRRSSSDSSSYAY